MITEKYMINAHYPEPWDKYISKSSALSLYQMAGIKEKQFWEEHRKKETFLHNSW